MSSRPAGRSEERLGQLQLRFFDRSPLGRARMLIWLVFIFFPLVSAVSSNDTGAAKALTIGAAAAFVAVFVWVALINDKPLPDRQALPVVAFLLSTAVVLTVADRDSWATLFIYCVACVAMTVRKPFAFPIALLCVAACAGSLLARGASAGSTIGYATSTLGIGIMMLVLADLRERNKELHQARAELARLAVAEERARFARDLHDLLGHSLSVIALKAELAGRLLPHQGSEAAAHVSEIEDVARRALTEVREAASGYRRMTLDDELAGAQMALSAAGIETHVQRPSVSFDPAVETVLAWTVREGATNVIRHSHAARCSVTITAGLAEAGVEVLDDGSGNGSAATAVNGQSGHGIEGLSERVQHLHGRLEAGARPEGGFRLAVSLPVQAR